MSVNEYLPSMILTDAKLIAYLYNIIKESASETVSLKLITDSKNKVNIVRPGIPGVNRATTDCRGSGGASNDFRSCRHSNKYSIEYNPADLMIVGGCALNIYDYLLRELKERREINALETYLKKRTSDIDIVWWPRPSTDKEIIVSSSEAIQNVVFTFKEQLVKNFAAKKDEINTKLKPYLKDASVEIAVELLNVRRAGVWSVIVYFNVANNGFKMCDISVHDSGSSQLYDTNGNIITDLRFMTQDPIYCTSRQGLPNSISYLLVDDVFIAVPNIESFIKQQMLAFDNLLRRGEVRAFINYKRVEFIKKVLQNIVLTNSNNRNYKELMDVFKTDNPGFPQQLISEIDMREKQSISKLRDEIKKYCSENTDDEFIKQLCKRATTNEEAQSKAYLTGILPIIETVKERLRFKSKDEKTTSQIRREYDELFRGVENLRVRLIRSSPMEIVHISQGNDPLQPILEREGKMDEVVNKLFANKKAEANRREQAARKEEEFRMAQKQQQEAERAYRASMGARPGYHITHHPPGSHILPPGASWAPAQIIPLPFNGPPPPVFIDPATGQKWYTHPTTGQIIVQGPDGRWYPRDLPSVLVSFRPPLPPGPPPSGPKHFSRGKGVGTRKNRKANNTT